MRKKIPNLRTLAVETMVASSPSISTRSKAAYETYSKQLELWATKEEEKQAQTAREQSLTEHLRQSGFQWNNSHRAPVTRAVLIEFLDNSQVIYDPKAKRPELVSQALTLYNNFQTPPTQTPPSLLPTLSSDVLPWTFLGVRQTDTEFDTGEDTFEISAVRESPQEIWIPDALRNPFAPPPQFFSNPEPQVEEIMEEGTSSLPSSTVPLSSVLANPVRVFHLMYH